MDEPGFHARRKAEKEYHEQRRLAKLGQGGIPLTKPLDDTIDEGHETARRAHPAQPHVAQPTGTGSNPGSGPAAGENEQAPGVPAPLPTRKRMDPYLAVMLGPILRYDTILNGVYHGFAMIVTSDPKSSYSPPPTLRLEWDTRNLHIHHDVSSLDQKLSELSVDELEKHVNKRIVQGERIYVFESGAGGQSFWRFKLEIPLGEMQTEIFYSVNRGVEKSFFVPAINQNLRFVSHSCNGFSAGVDTSAFNGPDPLWSDVLQAHTTNPFHVLIGGGDQLYCDPLTREPELDEWMHESDRNRKKEMQVTPVIRAALDRFFFNHYTRWFRGGAFGRAIQMIPMVNQADDHDIIDGFGSYPDDWQSSPIFSEIGNRGYFWFLLFQMFIVDAYDGCNPGIYTTKSLSTIIGGDGAWIPHRNHSFLTCLGPKVYLLALDCRSERKLNQICSSFTYETVFQAIQRMVPDNCEHLIFMLGVPIVYPRMVAIETILSSKINPLNIVSKSGLLGLGGYTNNFNKDAELLDDMNDHWCASVHKKERNWLIEQCQKIALSKHIRISFLSGDVHCASASYLYTLGMDEEKDRVRDPNYMVQIVTSAIVNTPPPPPVLAMVSTFGRKSHKTLHYLKTGETMMNLFDIDTDGTKRKLNNIMGRRNYTVVEYKEDRRELNFGIKVEIKQGNGTTKEYAVGVPGPGWK